MKALSVVVCTAVMAAALWAQTGRSVFDLTLYKRPQAVQVTEGVSLLLKGTDPTKQRASFVVVVGALQIEQKDWSIQVPFYFYSGTNTERPSEIVLTHVDRDQVILRLVTPK